MKIALLLIGELRTFSMVKYLHKTTIVDKHDTDVFLSMDCEEPDAIQEAISFFNPLDSFYNGKEDQDQDHEMEFFQMIMKVMPSVFDYVSVDTLRPIFREYFYVKQAYDLLQQHIVHTGQHYDVVVRMRFDQFVWTDDTDFMLKYLYKKEGILCTEHNTKLLTILMDKKNPQLDFKWISDDVSNHHDKTMYLLGFGPFENYQYANDHFFYHSAPLIPIVHTFYDSMPTLINQWVSEDAVFPSKGCIIEYMFYGFLQYHHIAMKKTHIKGIFVTSST